MTEQDSGWRRDEAPQHVEQADGSLSPVSPSAHGASLSERPPSSSQPEDPQRAPYGAPDLPASRPTWSPTGTDTPAQPRQGGGYPPRDGGGSTASGYTEAGHTASPSSAGYGTPVSEAGHGTSASGAGASGYAAPASGAGYGTPSAEAGHGTSASGAGASGYATSASGAGYGTPSAEAGSGASSAGGFVSPAGGAGYPPPGGHGSTVAGGAGYPPPGGHGSAGTGGQPTVQQPADPHHMWSRPGSAPTSAAGVQGYSTGGQPTVNHGGAPQPVSGPVGQPVSGGPDGYPTAAYPAGGQPGSGPAGHPTSGADGYPTSGYPGIGGGDRSTGYPTASYAAPGQPSAYPGNQPGTGGPAGLGQPGGYPAGNYYPGQAAAAPRRGRGGLIVLIIIVALVLTVGSGTVGGLIAHRSNASSGTTVVRESVPDVNRDSVAGIADKVLPSVVDITTDQGEGSGVIMTSDGSIVTNNHVVEGATGNTVNVTFSSGKTAKATIVGTDPAGDIAVIKAQGVSGLAAATFGDSDGMRVGDTVLAIGSPLGLQGSVSEGIISALHRTISEGSEDGQSATRSISDALQTDAAINPGNSGGALINLNGQVIGINTAIATSGQGSSSGNIGVGFAISSNRVKSAADQLSKGGKVSHPFLGVGLTDGTAGGALIANVVSGGPADKAGLRKGDVVMQADGKDVADSTALINAVQGHKVGDQLQLSIQRNGAQQQVTVTLGETPQ